MSYGNNSSEEQRFEQLLNMPSRAIRILAHKYGLNEDASLASLRCDLAEIEDITEDEDFDFWR
jgi:hypothetical protein